MVIIAPDSVRKIIFMKKWFEKFLQKSVDKTFGEEYYTRQIKNKTCLKNDKGVVSNMLAAPFVL